MREHAATRLGCEATDDLALLAGLGGDCAGAIQLHAPERRPPAAGGVGCRWLSEAELAACLRELPQHPLGLDETRDVRVCLAGAQDKLPVVIDRRARTGLSRGGRPTTHVLKVQVDGLEDTHVNEAFCLGLARRLGLPAVGASLRRAEDVSYLAVARYDRRREGGDIVRVHQEDVCQALALPPTRKYQAEGGPTLLDCVRLIRATSRRPDADVEMLLRAVALDYLIGNNDAHGKNLSFLRDGERGVRLAPLYDLGCTEVYPGLSRGMAMRIDEEETAEEIRAEHWRRLAQAAGLSWPVLGRWLQALAARAPPEARSLAAEMEAKGLGRTDHRGGVRPHRAAGRAARAGPRGSRPHPPARRIERGAWRGTASRPERREAVTPGPPARRTPFARPAAPGCPAVGTGQSGEVGAVGRSRRRVARAPAPRRPAGRWRGGRRCQGPAASRSAPRRPRPRAERPRSPGPEPGRRPAPPSSRRPPRGGPGARTGGP